MKPGHKIFLITGVALGFLAAALLASREQAFSRPPSPKAPRPGGISATVMRITDGDTLVCRVGGRAEKVRLIGVDAPETHTNEKFLRDRARDRRHTRGEILALGRKAREFTRRAVPPGSAVRLELDAQERDRYGRLLAYVWFAPKGARTREAMLNALLVSGGQAKAMTVPPNVKYAEMFSRLQKKARKEGKGIWAK